MDKDSKNNKIQKQHKTPLKNYGFIDDLSSDNVKSSRKIKNNNAGVIYSNPIEDEKHPKRRITKMNRKRYRRQNAGFAVLAIFFAAVLGISIYIIIKNNISFSSERNDLTTSSEAESSHTLNSIAENDVHDSSKNDDNENSSNNIISINNEYIHQGNLILVNYKYEYVFPKEDILVSMYNKNAMYSVSTTETYLQKSALDNFSELINDLYDNSGCDEVIVVSAYRSVEKQEEIYQDRLDRYGSEYAAAYVANPGYSEHHTGLAMDLSVYTKEGLTYDIETYDKCAWFNENYDKYGFILRYPEDKAGITSINYESWHYRYVGLPHSIIMDKLDLCLEEYIEYLKSYTADGKILKYSTNGSIISETTLDDHMSFGDSLVYYIKASEKYKTEIPIVENTEYVISGNNIDGFIVTLTYSK